MKKRDFIAILLALGYSKKMYGYIKITENTTHWVTVFDTSFQAYAYYTEGDEDEMGKTYDTSNVKCDDPVFFYDLIEFLTSNHN